MTTSEHIRPQHLARQAVVYVRQSTPHQLLRNQESLELQYALRDRAAGCGWPAARVRVIDADLGVTAASAAARPGFQELVALVSLGQVGLVLAYDATRLAEQINTVLRPGLTEAEMRDAAECLLNLAA